MSLVKLVSEAHALQSMRASDFDAYSAYGEVVDNSIEAGAKNIRIAFSYLTQGGKAPLEYVAFGDDGVGMNADTLHRCLQLGFSSRFNNRTGIGRFGVGATLGAINQCKRIEVYSKVAGDQWLHTWIDLDDIEKGIQEGIPEPTPSPIPAQFAKLVNEEHGTLVIWRKHDKQDMPAARLIEEFEVWAGRTYRRFIWKGVTIQLNGKDVPAIDPLYVNVEKTAFPGDPSAEEFAPMKLSWPVPRKLDGMSDEAPDSSDIIIRMSLLPEAFRPNSGSGNRSEVKARHIHRNEGLSIMRNDREVFYGHVPWWPGESFEEIDRWWGAEVSFDAVLDYSFSVKNIKRGAVPLSDLKKTLQQKIDPTRRSALERVRSLWKENKKKSENDEQRRRHREAEKAAKKGDGKLPKGSLPPTADAEKEFEQFTEDFLRAKTDEEKARYRELFRSQPFTIEDARWKGADFLEIKHFGGSDVLVYNSSHRFHSTLQEIEARIGGEDSDIPATKLRALVDLLLISFAKAQTMFPEGSDQEKLEQLRMYWGNFLQQYIGAWTEDVDE